LGVIKGSIVKQFSLICALALSGLAIPASATLMLVPYTVGLLPQPPASVLPGKLTSNAYVYLFLEQQHVTLTSPLAVDITMPGTYTMRTQLITGQIAAGTVVNSYFLHANPVNAKTEFLNQVMTFSTDELIIGIMAVSPTMASGVPVVGLAGTTYNGSAAGNGLKLATAGKDTIQISADQHTLTFSEQLKQGALTEFRIITTTVPVNTP
jgi:hypothetical protein